MLETIAAIFWYIVPAYVANASAMLAKGNTPIDQNIKFIDGKPLLGKGKTIKGFVFAVFVGVLVGAILGFVEGSVIPRATLALVLSFFAMVGDSVGSFVKRRFDLKQGQAAPFLDQWDFVLFAFLGHWLLQAWVPIAFPSLTELLGILVMTAFFHVGTNVVAYKAGIKKVPW
ncbi:MAG: CDP-2,3-bis-(O-geranylgeranyl)-sn-glycerol synthase [Candidatus Diapherotrites archaeon]|nr:CDP-2,3-bis-(O-geranylgeranyl)-sn-glycerol synthase [Candidatus Diapherotrites archaeon]